MTEMATSVEIGHQSGYGVRSLSESELVLLLDIVFCLFIYYLIFLASVFFFFLKEFYKTKLKIDIIPFRAPSIFNN